jgi:hypothetical protein
VTTVELSLPIRHPREVTASAEAHALIEGLARQIQAASAREQT